MNSLSMGSMNIHPGFLKPGVALTAWAVSICVLGTFYSSTVVLISYLLLSNVLATLFFKSLVESTYLKTQVFMMVICFVALLSIKIWVDPVNEMKFYFLVVASSSTGLLLPCIFSTKKRNLTSYTKVFSYIYGVISIIISVAIGSMA